MVALGAITIVSVSMTTLEGIQPVESGKRGGKRGNGKGSIYYQSARERWCGALSLENGMRKMIYGHSRREVRDKLGAALEKRRQGIPFTPERLTVGSWLDYWLMNVVEHDREPTTYDAYEVSVRLHIKPALGGIPLVKLQPERVERWLQEMESNGTGLRTRQFALARIRTALNLALKRGYVYRNVAELVEMPRSAQRKVAPRRKEDLRRLLDVIKDDRLQALVTVALAIGLRHGEMLGLSWDDVDLENRTLTVKTRVNRVRGRGLLVRDGAKTSTGHRCQDVHRASDSRATPDDRAGPKTAPTPPDRGSARRW